ncbi:uncharacterized protein TNCV_4489641 [Trichonephila clavipes]|nr:uncharacterized protein TNCV_4489641 [Trichonephila clavipes]
MNMKRKENFQKLPKELHQLKYEAISVPQGSFHLVKKTQERKSSTCYLLITKGVTSSSPVPLKIRRVGRDRYQCRAMEVYRIPVFLSGLSVDVKEDSHSDPLSTSKTEDNIEKNGNLVRSDHPLNTRVIADTIGIEKYYLRVKFYVTVSACN